MSELPELDRPCTACKTVGVVYNPYWQENEARIKDAFERADTDAEAREYTRNLPPEELGCGECDGVGRVPTDEGLRLLQFLRRYNR